MNENDLGQAFSIISNANNEMIVFITHHLIIYRPYDLISISVPVPRKVESIYASPGANLGQAFIVGA